MKTPRNLYFIVIFVVLGLFSARYPGGTLVEFLFYSLLLAVVLVFLGFGLCLLFCPQSLRQYILPISPLIGYFYVTLVGWYCFIYDLGGTDSYAVYVSLPPLIFLCFGIRKFKLQKISLIDINEWIIPISVGFLAFLVMSIPLIDNPQGLTTISLSNNDIADSATKATILKEFATSEVPGFLGQTDTLRYHLTLSYFGPNLLVAFSSSLFLLETYQLESLSIHVFFLFSILLFYSVARESLRYNNLAALGITALYGFNPLMWYIVYQGYLAQIVATTISLGFFLVQIKTIDHCKSLKDYFAYIPFAVFFNWGILISYPQVFLLVYVFVALYLIFSCLQDRSMEGISSWVNFFLKTFCLSLILSPHRVAGIFLTTLVVTTVDFGWFLPLIPPSTFLGILDIISEKGVIWFHDFTGFHGMKLILEFVLFIILIVFGLRQARKTDCDIFFLASASQLFIFSAYIVLAFKDGSGSSLGGYRSFKLLTFFLPLVLLSCLIVFRQTQWKNFFLIFPGALLLIANINTAYNLTKHLTKHYRSVTPDLVSLAKIEDNPAIKSINILGSDWWEILWQINFLLRKQLYFETNTYQGREQTALLGEWNLLSRKYEVVNFSDIEDTESIEINSTYNLKRAWESDKFGVEFAKGWQVREKTRLQIDSNQATVFLFSPNENQVIDLQVSFESAVPEQRLFISFQESNLRECSPVCRINKILLNKGRNIIRFQTEESADVLVSDTSEAPTWVLTSLSIQRSKTSLH